MSKFYQAKTGSGNQGLDFKKLKTDPSYTVILIDKSGSMSSYTDQVIDGYNYVIDSLRESKSTRDGAHFITTVLFSDDYEIVQEMVKLSRRKGMDKIIPLTAGEAPDGNFYPLGPTALYDCLYDALDSMGQILDIAKDNKVYPQLNIALISDGLDNVSTRKSQAVRDIIARLRAEEYLKVSVVLGLLDDKFTEDMLEDLRTTLGFERSFSLSKSAKEFRRVFKEMSMLIR